MDDRDGLYEKAANLATREDFVALVLALATDLRHNRGAWENPTLEGFLEALAGWVEDMDGYYRNRGVEAPRGSLSWQNIGDMLMAATMYE